MIMNREEYSLQVKAVWKATLILAVITIVEVVIARIYDANFHDSGYRMAVNIFMAVASVVKAFYIVAVFMHLKYEKKALAMTILMPLFFFIWFIIAFLLDGHAWHINRLMF
jgi:cytochrome c oxidase subunit IV